MTRKHAIHDAEAHVVTSHGSDFFGEDRHTLKSLTSLAGYAEGCLLYDERGPVVLLLSSPGDGGTMTPKQAAEVAEPLLKLARHRFVRPQESRVARALADAATRAADAGEPWQWQIESA
ncbi:hypothetical protein AB0C89_35780 [Streptomyces sp. NPDC048491]|uniref:DUF7739 domain-containing protein n=1 Tax=Streptomyces sp. NPDC048491 TaxID=3157207 RepID=UPI0034174895